MPSGISIGGVYLSPLLVASILGVVIAWLVTRLLNRLNLSRYFWWPESAPGSIRPSLK